MEETQEQIYFTKQILTYMGNKRKCLPMIDNVLTLIKRILNKDNINIAEGFSGSGIVSRLLKNRTTTDNTKNRGQLYINDCAGYSKTINQCYLTSLSDLTTKKQNKIISYCQNMELYQNETYKKDERKINYFITKHWAPNNDNNIEEDERAYFTNENAKIIDRSMYYIHNYVKDEFKPYLLGPLLIQCSMYNNTNGQFSAFFKDKTKKKGKFGGDKEIDLKRITNKISAPLPLLTKHKADVYISQKDTNEWIETIPEVDLLYLDPPYNKHPYCIYYFLLDIINNWDTTIDIPKTNRGQPKNWDKSMYCSSKHAEKTFEDLIQKASQKTKFILLSYNNDGIIPLAKIEEIFKKYGTLYKKSFEHKTYNKFKGIASYKRQNENKKIKECLWLLHVDRNK